jgi:hypothetical protein
MLACRNPGGGQGRCGVPVTVVPTRSAARSATQARLSLSSTRVVTSRPGNLKFCQWPHGQRGGSKPRVYIRVMISLCFRVSLRPRRPPARPSSFLLSFKFAAAPALNFRAASNDRDGPGTRSHGPVAGCKFQVRVKGEASKGGEKARSLSLLYVGTDNSSGIWLGQLGGSLLRIEIWGGHKLAN